MLNDLAGFRRNTGEPLKVRQTGDGRFVVENAYSGTHTFVPEPGEPTVNPATTEAGGAKISPPEIPQ